MNSFLPIAAAALAVAASPQLASANIISNGGFEQDTLGSTTVTDFTVQSGVDAVIVGPLTEGSRALQLSSLDETQGFFSAAETKLGSSFSFDSPLLTVGQEYTFSGALASTNGRITVTIVNQNFAQDGSGDEATGQYGNVLAAAATPGEGTKTFSQDFVYFGGELGLQAQISPFDGDTTGGAIGTFDNFSLTVVPEPASFAVLSSMGVLALRRRRA